MKNILLIIAGTIALVLGIIGIILPVLPTTPFILFSGVCFSISSPRLSIWLRKNKFLGSYIENYEKNTGIPKRVKIKAILFVWVGIILSMILNKNIIIKGILLLVAIFATMYLKSMKTKD